MTTELTDRQTEVLRWVRDYIDQHQNSPKFEEIAEAHDISINAARGHLVALKKKKKVTWEPNQPRTLKLLDPEEAA